MTNVTRDDLGREVTRHHSDFAYTQYFYYDTSVCIRICLKYCQGHYTAFVYNRRGERISTINTETDRVHIAPVTGPQQSWPTEDMMMLYGQNTPKELVLHLAAL